MVIWESGNFPEVDDFKWVDLIEAQSILNSAQIQALDKIVENNSYLCILKIKN